jgi:N-carbamoyl-L-amino-acid hydrolase
VPEINPDRLLADLRELRRFGACGHGVVRRALTPPDLKSREWLLGKMRDAGLDATIDGVGNVIGRSRNPGPALLMGSHTDTQPEGGWLDGAMGVMYALEIARALGEDDHTRGLALDIASWMDEEGAFGHFIGSRAFCGLLADDEVNAAVNADGLRLEEALRRAGYHGRPRARLEPGRHRGYLEAHIEQGGVLESQRKRIGVVTAIVGIRMCTLRFDGHQNHAGTTPMHLRRDAGMALFRFAVALDAAFREVAAPSSVWTIGRVSLHPGADSIVPGCARMRLQFRDPDAAVLERLSARLSTLIDGANAAGAVRISVEGAPTRIDPAPMDPRLQASIAQAAEHHAPGAWIRMPSGAGHDAQVFAPRLPAAMLFVPSIGGVSHSFEEDTAEADIVLGCQVAADAVAAILAGARS